MAISVGSVEVDVIPNTQGIYARLRDGLVPAATKAGTDAGKAAGRSFGPAMQAQVGDVGLRIGEEIGQQIANRLTAALRDAIRDGVTQGGRTAAPAATRAGDETGGAFARAMKARLEAAFKALPKVNIDANTSEADADLQALRVRMESLAGKTIGVDIDAEAARAEVDEIEAELARLGTYHPDVSVRADTATAIAQLQAVREEIDRISAARGTIHLQTDGTFGQRLRAQVKAAQDSLPNINIHEDTGEAEAQLASLRAQLSALADQRIGIDIDAATATAKVDEIQARLTRLAASDADVAVRVDAAAAAAQLAQIQAMVSALDHRSINLDTSGAMSAVFQLSVSIAALAAIPAVPVLAAGIGSIAAAGVAAGVGVGALAAVAIPAFQGIAGALQAQKTAQDAASSATAKGNQAASQGASRALQMAGAQQALATAERNGARQIVQAQKQVVQAKQQVADAVAQAAQQQQQADRAVATAEKDLSTAQKAATQAQLDLVAARKAAAQQLQDLNNQLTDSQLSQRDATLQVQQAQLDLNATLKDPKATQLQRAEAQLTYDQAVQHLKEQQIDTKRLQDQTTAANKAGVTGSDTYKQAQDAVSQAQQTVVDKTQALRDAQVAQAQTQVQNARAISDAQSRVADATANVAVAQQSAADAVASAQRQIQSASIAAAGGVDQAATAQAKYQQALAKLTPSARATFDAFVSLRGAFKDWSASLQPQVMPLFTRAINGLKNSLPGLTPFVLAAAKGIGELEDKVSKGFKSPWWDSFKKDLAGSIEPAIVGLGVSFGRIFVGMAGIIDAFLPHMDTISTTMQRITGRFADWGKNLKGSPEFERFLSYASTQAPKLGDTLGKVADAFLDIGKAVAPLSGLVLATLGGFASGVSLLAQKLPGLVQIMYGLWVATKLYKVAQVAATAAMVVYRAGVVLATLLTQGWTAAVEASNLAFEANPIVAIVTIIVAALALLVVGILYAWNHWSGFRTVVLAVWDAIKVAALFVWNSILKPTFDAIVVALQAVGTAASWLWSNVLSPVFGFIGTAARILLTIIVVAVIAPIILAFKAFGAIGQWLWANALKPAFDAIGQAAVWLWRNFLKPQFDAIVTGAHAIGTAASWLWHNAISPAFNGIATVARWLYANVIKPQFAAITKVIHALGDVGTWLWKNAISPAFHGISSVVSSVWKNGIKPQFDAIKSAVGLVGKAFDTAKNAVGKAWDKLEAITKKPVAFVINTVYNSGIVGVWNKVAKAFGAPPLSPFHPKGFATGGVLPGYTPGRDVHSFYSPTGGGLELSGGEAIMRPEFTRAVGPSFISGINRLASSGGSSAVKKALAPELGGSAPMPTQRFADGGIFGWIGKTAAGLGSDVWSGVKKTAGWLKDGVEASARAGVKNIVEPLLKKFPGADTGFGKMMVKIPSKLVDTLFGYGKEADKKGAGGLGGPRIQAALKWAKTQAGLPYQWAGNGNPSWDCSGLMSAIESVIRGQKPHRRWATGAFSGKTAPPGWVLNGKSPFQIGITNAGVGHTAGTLGGTNVESRGGAGVIVGPKARGWNNSLFGSHYGFMPGKYDSGGYLQPGMNLAYNGTGKPEPVFTTQQANALARGGAGPDAQPVRVEIHTRDEALADFVDVRVYDANQRLIQNLTAGGGR